MLERTDGESIMDNPGIQTLDKDREWVQIKWQENKKISKKCALEG